MPALLLHGTVCSVLDDHGAVLSWVLTCAQVHAMWLSDTNNITGYEQVLMGAPEHNALRSHACTALMHAVRCFLALTLCCAMVLVLLFLACPHCECARADGLHAVHVRQPPFLLLRLQGPVKGGGHGCAPLPFLTPCMCCKASSVAKSCHHGKAAVGASLPACLSPFGQQTRVSKARH